MSRFLRAYYHTFTTTGQDDVDGILEAVALAGKAYHHTEGWCERLYHEHDTAESMSFWERIQDRADSVATDLQAAEAQAESLAEELNRVSQLLAAEVERAEKFARATDPESSHDAAVALKPIRARLERKALLWYQQHGPASSEQCAKGINEKYVSISRTVTTLERKGMLVDTGTRVSDGVARRMSCTLLGYCWSDEP